jgi:hypothetical protein
VEDRRHALARHGADASDAAEALGRMQGRGVQIVVNLTTGVVLAAAALFAALL